MKKVIRIFSAILFLSILTTSCNLFKSEDEKISEILVGKSYEEDETAEKGLKVRNIRYEFFKDGHFEFSAILEVNNLEEGTVEVTFKISGTWKVKDKFIYYTYNFDELLIEPEEWSILLKEDLIKGMKETNTPDKVIDYDASKIIYENSDGARKILKKSY